MWLFTSRAFVSIVVDRNDASKRLVRARCKEDLLELFPDVDVMETVDADYRFRTFLPAEEVEKKMGELIRTMDYDNFKNSIPPEKYDYLHCCHSVWGTMRRMQD